MKESRQQIDLDVAIRLIRGREDYIKILLCLEEPKTQGELIECAISSGVFKSPTAVRYKIITLERHGILRSVRMGKYRVITADRRVLEAVKRMVAGSSGGGAEPRVEEGEEEKKTGLEQTGAGFEAVATVVKEDEEEEESREE